MTPFNAAASRAKRPCPIWVDAFQRDTQHLEADEIGAYFLIIMAMWARESCDLPDDDSRLARVARVSVRLWKSRIGPVIREMLSVDGETVFSKRLRQEADYVEREVQRQSDRKRGTYTKPQGDNNCDRENEIKPRKCLKSNEPASSTDTTTDEPRHYPSQQPNNLLKKERTNVLSKEDFGIWFQEFWDAYPHRDGKKNRKGAEAKFRQVIKSGVTADEVMAGVRQMHRFPNVQRGYVRNPVTWLNQRGWEDEPPAAGESSAEPTYGEIRISKSGEKRRYVGGQVHWERVYG